MKKISFEIFRHKGLAQRWLTNVLSLLVALIILVVLCLTTVMSSFYYDIVQRHLVGRMNSAQVFFQSYNIKNSVDFEQAVHRFVEEYEERERMEVQFFNTGRELMMTTSGLLPEENSALPDRDLPQGDPVVVQRKLPSGEQIMQLTFSLSSAEENGLSVGYVRMLTSLSQVNRELWLTALFLSVVGLMVVLISVLSGAYFIKSIVGPVRMINQTARRIASGDLEVRIENESRDEIGELCNSINYMAEELDAAERMKNEFISSVSHELRTPLTAIKGWGETVQASSTDPEVVQMGLDVIIRESDRLSNIVEDLLDFSRLQNGRFSFTMDKCDVAAELEEAVLTYADAAKRAEVTLTFDEGESVPLLMADGNRLRQVFINVIDNAMKYTPGGGKILADVRGDDERITVMISDTGCGIPEEELSRITTKFYKGRNAVRGSGIGLAVAEEIVLAHGGTLEVSSAEGVGTTVTITLPLSIPEKTEAKEEE